MRCGQVRHVGQGSQEMLGGLPPDAFYNDSWFSLQDRGQLGLAPSTIQGKVVLLPLDWP
jgi:hypothetical protein